MRTHFLPMSLLFFLPIVAAAEGPSPSSPESLYVLSAHGKTVEDGTLLTMTVRETRRTPDLSIVDIDYVSGGSASSLFLIQGLCGVMIARGHTFAVAEQVSEKPIEFQVTFPTSAKVEEKSGLPRMVLSASDCAHIQGRHE